MPVGSSRDRDRVSLEPAHATASQHRPGKELDREQDVLQCQLRAVGTGSSAASPASPSLSGAAHEAGLGGL